MANRSSLSQRTPADPLTPDLSLGSSSPAVQPFAIAPIRTSADYAEDSDSDDAPTPRTATRSSAGRTAHKARPSAAGLLSPVEDSESSSAGLDDLAQIRQQRRLAKEQRIHEYDNPIVDPLESNLSFFERVRAFVKLNEGFLLIALSQFFFASVNTCVKLLQLQVAMPVWEVIWIRMVVTFVGSYLMLRISGDPNPLLGPPGVRFLLVVRGFIGFFGLAPGYYSLQYLDLSDSAVLVFLSPGIVAILAHFLLKEPYTRLEAFGTLFSLIGVCLIAKPTFLFGAHEVEDPNGPTPHQRAMAVAACLLSALGSAGAYLAIRYIGKRCQPGHSILFFSAMCVVTTTIAPFVLQSKPVFSTNLSFWLLMIPIGLFGFGAQILLTMGLQRENAGRGTLAVYSNVIFALILERVVFNTFPDLWSLLGSAIIIGSALKAALSKQSAAAVTAPPKDLEAGEEEEEAEPILASSSATDEAEAVPVRRDG